MQVLASSLFTLMFLLSKDDADSGPSSTAQPPTPAPHAARQAPSDLFFLLQVFGVHLNKWQLDKKLGCGCLFLYGVFLCFSIMTEFNVFTFVNLPMCGD